MAYKALYRTYRPTRFDEVVGQKHIIKILENAVSEGKISHAYIFSGLRGIGKTTIARIFAKAVNCTNPQNGEPCNECPNCRAIMNDETTDVVELDAASNNGVDQMREILEKVNFLPSKLKKKVYIIDEAHMLSTAAFNALLKTLEEPPAHVIFILATTEPYKIPSTILSRCQRLDFKQLSTHEIIEMLIKVCEKENIKITDEALQGIAEMSEGGMRDALSILDQARVYNFEQITIEDIDNITGRVSYKYLTELITALNNQDTEFALDKVTDLIEMGKEVNRILTSLIQFCRDLLLYKSLREGSKIQYIYNKEDFVELATQTSESKLFYYVDMFVDIQNKIRFTNSPKIYLEVGIIKIINGAAQDIDVLAQIQKIEEKIENIQVVNGGEGETEIISRINTLDNQVKKLNAEVNRQNIQTFKEKIEAKISMLEDLSLANKAQPAQLEEKIQEISESIQEIEVKLEATTAHEAENTPTTDQQLNERINTVENKTIEIKEPNTLENFELGAEISKIKEELEKIKNSASVKENKDTTNYQELLDRITKLEENENSNAAREVQENQEMCLKTSDFEQKTDTTNYQELLDRITKLEENENSNAVGEVQDNSEIYQKLANLEEKVSNITTFDSQDGKDNSSTSNDLKERIVVVEEYLDMIINRVDELARNMKMVNVSGDENYTSNTEVDQLNENYISLVTLVQNLQLSLSEMENKLANVTDNAEYKEEINTKIENAINDIQSKIVDTRGELTNSIIANYNDLLDKVNELSNQHSDDYMSLIQDNKQAIQDAKDYSIKLSIRIQEIQTKVDEINTKLDGGLTKRRSPFEIVREPEENENEKTTEPVIAKAKEEEVETPTSKVEERPSLIKNERTVVIRTPLQREAKELETTDESAKVYDVKIVERILHQARDQKCREEKINILSNWSKLEDRVGHLLSPTAKLLSEGTLTANGYNELLIVYPHASMCNHLMEPKGHTNALQVLKITFGKDYDFIALPENTWQEKRLEYAGQYNMGIKYPRLTPIKNPELKVVVINTSTLSSKKNQSIHQAESFFGEDIVEKEEE